MSASANLNSQIDSLDRSIESLEADAEQCSVLPKIVEHLDNSNEHMAKGAQAGLFGGATHYSLASDEIQKATALMRQN